MNSESYRYNNVWAKRSDVMNDNNPDVNTSTGTQSNGAYRGEWSSLGYFGRLNYDFDGRYLFEFNIRRDGSSRFRADSRWATFPSIIRKSKFPQNPKRSVRFSGKRTKRSVQKRKARNTQKAETKVL